MHGAAAACSTVDPLLCCLQVRAELQQQEELLVQKEKQLLAHERKLHSERTRADDELAEVQGASREALQHVRAMEAEKQQLEQHLQELQEAAAKMEQEVRRWKEVATSAQLVAGWYLACRPVVNTTACHRQMPLLMFQHTSAVSHPHQKQYGSSTYPWQCRHCR
jgi:hypothetical protein